MGRGRAKAKQTKVARELKYHSGGTDLTALQRELSGPAQSRPVAPTQVAEVDEDDLYVDPYADAFAEEDDGDEPGATAAAR